MWTFRKLPRQGDSSKGELPTVDVGPIPRQFLTRTDRFFGSPDYLTLSSKLIRRQVAERAMWAALIIVEPPHFDDGLRLGE